MNKTLKLWEEYKKSIKPIKTEMCTTSLFSRKTTCTPFQITPKPTFEGFMDWQLENKHENK